MKVCKMCNLEKELKNMVKDKRRKDGCTSFCLDCNKLKVTPEQKIKRNIEKKKYREENKEYFKVYNKIYKDKNKEYFKEYYKEYAKNNDTIKEYQLEYRNRNKEYFNEYNKEYYLKNSDNIKENVKEYRENNKDKINKNRRVKCQNDPLFALSLSIRKSILKSIKSSINSKSKKTKEILGCTFDEFKLYLESKFETWMTWENRGLYNGDFDYGWDIDHIIPISTAITEDDIYRLNNYKNLQPLCSKINRDIKKDKIDYKK